MTATITPADVSQLNAPNLTVDAANGVTFAYRRFGPTNTDAPPLLFLQHFRGNIDGWDPILVDTVAEQREVILLDNRGVGGSSGVVPDNVTDMARNVGAFADALGLEKVDILGFSLGGYVAQEIALLRPWLPRRIILAGTAPQGGPNLHRWTPDVINAATGDRTTAEKLLSFFFSPSEASQAKGREFIARIFARKTDRDKRCDPGGARRAVVGDHCLGDPRSHAAQPTGRHYTARFCRRR